MNTKSHFHSLNKKMAVFGSFLTCLLIVFFLLIWGSNHYLFQQQNRLLNVQQQFSSLVYGLGEIDSSLYAYAQKNTEELNYKCRLVLEEVKASADKLSALLELPIFTDLWHMVQTYGESADKLLTVKSQSTGHLLSLYQESAEHLKIIDSLMHEYDLAVDADRSQRQKQLEELQTVINYLMVISCILLVGSCILFFVNFSRHITHRILHLTGQAEKICQGDWNAAVGQASQVRDEVDVLANAFYRMLEVIRRQIEQLKYQEAMERHLKEAEVAAANMKARLDHAQLRTLQSRVNPHFLFNTLNVIAGQAAEESAFTTMEMLLKTADYLRYSLDKLDKVVSLKEELQNVEDYFQIQKNRFRDRLQFYVQYQDFCSDIKVPSMILQPLCENALIHGIMPLNQGGCIRVETDLSMDRVRITVTDNGVGMSKERLNEVRWRTECTDYDDTEGIGLSNIMQRLRAFFQGDAQCEIAGCPGSGTSVALVFPALRSQENGGEINDKSYTGG